MKNYNKRIIPFAQYLRKNMTSAERKLWYHFLRSYPLRFQRQKPIYHYIADFYCAKAKLIIEVDGPNHALAHQQFHDYERSKTLKAHGFTVIRFTNEDIEIRFGGVCQAIDNTIKNIVE